MTKHGRYSLPGPEIGVMLKFSVQIRFPKFQDFTTDNLVINLSLWIKVLL